MKYTVELLFLKLKNLCAGFMRRSLLRNLSKWFSATCFENWTNVDSLSPKRDALTQHINTAHWQTKVRKQSLTTHPDLPSPRDCGWNLVDRMFVCLYLTTGTLQSNCVRRVNSVYKENGNQGSTRHCAVEKEGCCALVPVLVPLLHGVKTVRRRKKIRLLRKWARLTFCCLVNAIMMECSHKISSKYCLIDSCFVLLNEVLV